MSLFLNLLFETDSYSNEYLLAKFGFDTAEDSPVYQPTSQPRTSLVKFARSPRTDPPGLPGGLGGRGLGGGQA